MFTSLDVFSEEERDLDLFLAAAQGIWQTVLPFLPLRFARSPESSTGFPSAAPQNPLDLHFLHSQPPHPSSKKQLGVCELHPDPNCSQPLLALFLVQSVQSAQQLCLVSSSRLHITCLLELSCSC